MFENQKQYEKYIKKYGVGSNDRVSDSIKSYVSYLNAVSKHLEISINSKTLSSKADIEVLSARLKGKVAKGTIENYRTAMNRYIEMIAT